MIGNKHKIKKKLVEPLEVLEKSTNKIVDSTIGKISFKDFFTDLKTDDASKKEEDDKKKTKEMEEKQKNKMKGRDVESELKELREKKRREEEDEERKYQEAEQEKKKRLEAEQEAMLQDEMVSHPSKQKKKRGGAFLPASKKSQTKEYANNPD
jgi:hypothetical protein